MIRRIVLLALVLSWGWSSLSASIRDESFSMTVTGGGYVYDGEEKLYATPVLGTRLGFDMIEHMGLEASFNFAESKSKIDKVSSINTYLYRLDALFYLMPQSSFVPYLSAGGGVIQNIGFQGLADSSAPVLDYGVGAKMFVADSVALRVEGRHFAIFDTDRRFNYEGTFGINYYFGRGRKHLQQTESIDTPSIGSSPAAEQVVPASTQNASEPPPVVAQNIAVQEPSTPGKVEEHTVQEVLQQATEPTPTPVVVPVPEPLANADIPKPQKTLTLPADEMTSELKVKFAPRSAVVKPRYHDEIMKLADLLKFYPTATARLEGYGDGSGTKASKQLGMKRAESIKAYMVYHFGIAAKRLAPAPPSAGSTIGTIRITIFSK